MFDDLNSMQNCDIVTVPLDSWERIGVTETVT